jgi:GTPase
LKSSFSITEKSKEKAILIGVSSKITDTFWPIDSSIEELSALSETAGADITGSLIQRLEIPSPTYYFGKGKIQELIELKSSLNYDVVIVNDELLPRQQRNLEDALEVKIIDRTALILDIFARSAHTREGQLQVDLAQHQYLLPRLAGQWSHLERLGGGIGTRGPGESQLETDRRLIRQRIKKLEFQIEDIRKHRSLYRVKRKKNSFPVVALIGYTNAGKSTLLNALCKSDVVVENKLFSTLDPVTRKLTLSNGKIALLTDTVGFIHKLPPTIIAAFRATLEEMNESNVLLHVVDITHKNASEQFRTVEDILNDLEINSKPRIILLNKVDMYVDQFGDLAKISESFKIKHKNIISISAKKSWGLDNVLENIMKNLNNADYCEN